METTRTAKKKAPGTGGPLAGAKRLLRRVRRRVRDGLLSLFSLTPRFERVRIEREVVEDICGLAAGSAPKEMVAFLIGSVKREGGQRVLVIDGLYIKAYQADENSTHFTTQDLPSDNVYGTVHSHPGFSNRPSDADRQLFNKYGWFHLIVCQPYTAAAIATYNKYGEPISGIELQGTGDSGIRGSRE